MEDIKASKRTFQQKIHSNLINSDNQKYISYKHGRQVINWMDLNTDSKKIERMCNGIVPPDSEDLQAIIKKHDSQTEEKLPVTSSKSKFVKELWAMKGVTFPGSGPLHSTSSTAIPVPNNSEEEQYQLSLALRESRRDSEVPYPDTHNLVHTITQVPSTSQENVLEVLANVALQAQDITEHSK